MSWIPIGPTSVVGAREIVPVTRITRSNAPGSQCAVFDIAVHPVRPENIAVVTNRVGGSSAFITHDDGHSWRAMTDNLPVIEPRHDLRCIAFHPTQINILYLGSERGHIFRSENSGRSWERVFEPPCKITHLIVNSNSGASRENTTIYAGTSVGIYISTDGGESWRHYLIGEITSLAIYMPRSSTPHIYAGVYGQGLFHFRPGVDTPRNLFGSEYGLTSSTDEAANAQMSIFVDYAPRNPERVYALFVWLSSDHANPVRHQLYVSSVNATGIRTWQTRDESQLQIERTLLGTRLLVAPENAGTIENDVLLFTADMVIRRSLDGGARWDGEDLLDPAAAIPARPGIHRNNLHHADMRSLAQYPAKPAYYPEVLATTSMAVQARIYLGSDGGLASSNKYTNRAFDIHLVNTLQNGNAGPAYDSEAIAIESLNNGLAAIACHQCAHNINPLAAGAMAMLSYISTIDTGVARRKGAFEWATAVGGDAGLVFYAPQAEGIRIWSSLGEDFIRFPIWALASWIDSGTSEVTFNTIVTPGSGRCGPISNLLPDAGAGMFASVMSLEPVTQILRWAILPSMIRGNRRIQIFPTIMTSEMVVGARFSMIEFTPPSFTITEVGRDHFFIDDGREWAFPPGTPIRFLQFHAAQISATRARWIGAGFPAASRLYRLAYSPATATLLAASADSHLWQFNPVTSGATGSWQRVEGQPIGLASSALAPEKFDYIDGLEEHLSAPLICWITNATIPVTTPPQHLFYVILSLPVMTLLDGVPISTALFSVNNNTWVPERNNMPDSARLSPGSPLGQMVAHPLIPGRLYVARQTRIFQLERATDGHWDWTLLEENLPRQDIHSLWIGNIAPDPTTPPRFVLRAATAVRGVWERELDALPHRWPDRPYFHDHQYDPGWTAGSLDGVPDPIFPDQRHYHWQSPDIKVDTPLPNTDRTMYYQTTPEFLTPSADDFLWIDDRSVSRTPGALAHIWVRLNNRSVVPSGPLHVWALVCNYSGVSPVLPTDFWSRFHPEGTLAAAPVGRILGDWVSLGIETMNDLHAEHADVRKFELTLGAVGDHKCVLLFAHGPSAPLDTSGLSLIVNEIVPQRAQIAQRNIIVERPASRAAAGALSLETDTSPTSPGRIGATEEDAQAAAQATPPTRHYIEFNNPTDQPRKTRVVFDLRDLEPEATLYFQLAAQSTPPSMTGAQPMPFWRNLFDQLGEWFGHFLKPEDPTIQPTQPTLRLPLNWRIYQAKGGTEVVLDDMLLEAGKKTAARFWLQNAGDLKPGYEYHLDILQYADQRLAGGATVIFPIKAATTKQTEPTLPDNEREIADKLWAGASQEKQEQP